MSYMTVLQFDTFTLNNWKA